MPDLRFPKKRRTSLPALTDHSLNRHVFSITKLLICVKFALINDGHLTRISVQYVVVIRNVAPRNDAFRHLFLLPFSQRPAVYKFEIRTTVK